MKETNYGVYLVGGSISCHDRFVKTGLTKAEAKTEAKFLRKLLSVGERKYYGMSYLVRRVG